MRNRTTLLALVVGLGLLAHGAAPLSAQDAGDERDRVRAAVLDYVEALYRMDPSRIDRSVHPELTKRGFRRNDAARRYEELHMTQQELRGLAARWNRAGRANPETAVREIVVYDVLAQTATAKLTAHWGTDYLHLAKYDGRWQIVHVLWQGR